MISTACYGGQDGLIQILNRGFFIEECPSTRFFHGDGDLSGVLNRKPDHDHTRLGGFNDSCGFDAVHSRHVHIHENDIRLQLTGQGNRLLAVGSFADNLNAGICIQQPAQP